MLSPTMSPSVSNTIPSSLLYWRAPLSQVVLMNQGEYLTLLSTNKLHSRENQSPPAFPSVQSDPATWRPSSFGSPAVPHAWNREHVTLLDLESEATYDSYNKFLNITKGDGTVSEADFSAWRVEFNYVNNFLHVTNGWKCGGVGDFDINFARTDAPNALQTEFHVSPSQDWPRVPFQILMRSEFLSEIAVVTDVLDSPNGANQTLILKRDKATDLSTPNDKFPEDWQCPLEWYNDSVSCDCNCGAPDADCDSDKSLPVTRCPLPYSTVDTGSMCSRSGLCTFDLPAKVPQIWLSEGCWRIFAPGEVNLVAFAGSVSDFQKSQNVDGQCSPCPADTIYDGQATLGNDGVYSCYAKTTANIQMHLPPWLIKHGNDKLAARRLARGPSSTTTAAASSSGPSATPLTTLLSNASSAANATSSNGTDPVGSNTTAVGSTAAAARCGHFSALWYVCTDAVYSGLETWIYARFEKIGMSFPVITDASPIQPVVEIMLENSVTFTGVLVYSDPPNQALQFMVLRPLPTAKQDPSSALQMVDAVLYSAINFDTISLVAGCSQRTFDGSFGCYRPGVDKNFVTYIGRDSVRILDALSASEITGLAARAVGDSQTTYFNPTCGGIAFGNCNSAIGDSDGKLVNLRMTRPMPITLGRKVLVRAFAQCEGITPSNCPAGKRNQLRTPERDNLFQGIVPFPYVGEGIGKNGTAHGRRLLQAGNASTGGEGAAGNGTDGNGTTAGATSSGDVTLGEYVFPVDKRPIVIIRSRGQVVEVRLVNKTAGRIITLDADVEGDIDLPATIETTFDGGQHACVPSHHPCIHTLFRVRVQRQETAYLPDERYLRHTAEPTQSPEQLDLELAMFKVPLPNEEQKVSARRRSDGGGKPVVKRWESESGALREGVGGGRRGGGREERKKGTSGSSRRQNNGTDANSNGPVTQYLCPNLISNNSLIPEFKSFGWEQWKLRDGRDFEMQGCIDMQLSSDDCKDLESIPDDQFRQICNKVMPPTYETTFKFKVPLNNKWKAPESILQRNGNELVNRPEFEFDFSLIYHLQYRFAALPHAHAPSLLA